MSYKKQQKARRLYELNNKFLELSEAYSQASHILQEYAKEFVDGLDLEVPEWLCPKCRSLHAYQIDGKLNVPQPVDGFVECIRGWNSCGEKSKVEDAVEELRKFKEFIKKEEEEKRNGKLI